MNLQKITKAFYPLFLFLLLTNSTSGIASVTWGVQVGEIGVYWLDEVKVSQVNENLAPLLGDTNRTAIVAITSKSTDSLNYTLGLTNGTNNLFDQQINIEELVFNDQSFFLPSGSFPFVLPLSVGDFGNYLQTLASQASLLNILANQIVASDENLTFIENIEVNAIYGKFFNISTGITLNNISSFTGIPIGGFNVSELVFVAEGENITSVDIDLSVSYNTTDGMLIDLAIDGGINTIAKENNSTIFNSYSFNASIIRRDFIPLEQIVSIIDSLVSSIEDTPYFGLITLPVLFLISRKKRKSN